MSCFGCSTVQSVSPTFLLVDSTKSITVYLFDSRIIKFKSGNYSVTESTDSSYITGIGLIVHKNSPKQETFSGIVGFREITEVKYREDAESSETNTLIVVGSIVVGVLVFLFTFNPIHM